MAEANVGDIVARLRVDTSEWARGLQAATEQLTQFQRQVTQQGGAAATQLGREQMQAATLAAREQMQQARLAAQEQMQQARLAAQGQIQAARGATQEQVQAARTASAERIQASRAASQAEVLDFRRSVEAARQAAREQRDAMRAAQAEARSSGGGLAGMLQVAGGIGLATTIGGLVSGLRDFAASTVQTGARLEQLRASLSAIAGSTAAGQQQFQFLTTTAQQLGVALEPIARGWRTLTAAATQANLPLADQQRLLTALATEARRVGASNEELNRAIVAVAQSASKGKLSMEELRQQLGEALPTAFAAVARGMGRTTEELEKLIETGSVRFPAFARALTRGFEQMQAASGQMTETSQAAFNRLGNALTAFKDALAQNILPELGRLARVAQSILETATKIINVTGGRGGGGVQGPTPADLGGTESQQRELQRLNQVITTLEARRGAGTPLMQETTRTQIQNAIELRDEIYAAIRATQDQGIEQGKVTAEVNKTATQRQLEADYVTDVTKKLEELRAKQEAFKREAALSPERLGRPGSAEFLKGMQQVTEQELDALTKLAAQPPQGVTLSASLRQQLLAADVQVGQLGRQREALLEQERAARKSAADAIREEEQARRESLQQAMAGGQEYLRGIDQQNQALEQAHEQLARMGEQYGMAKANRDAFTASTLEATLAESRYAEEAAQTAEAIRDIAQVEAQLPELRRHAASSALAFAQSQREQAAVTTLEENLAQARMPRGTGGFPFGRSREELRLQQRTGADIRSDEGQRRAQELRQALLVQERLNYAAGLFADLGSSVGSAWTQALTSIADHTQTVAQAFQAMARSIIQSLGQIAAQEGFKALIGLGVGLITGAALGGGQAGFGAGSGFDPTLRANVPLASVPMQHGGIVRAPTLAMLGENPSTAPEAIFNRQQLQSLFGGSSSSQGGNQGVTVINVASRQQGEQMAAQERAMGRTAVINFVLDELSTGESSRINRSLRALQR